MDDSNILKSIVSAANFSNNMERSLSPEESFDFPSLPWVCQRRFAELCKGRTLKKFASINSFTRNLSKRCHSIDKVQICNCSESYYSISCYCAQPCRRIDLSRYYGKKEVMIEVYISNYSRRTIFDAQYFQSLPISFKSNEKLRLNVRSIKFSLLKTLITSNLINLEFAGQIEFDCSLMEFIEFIKALLKLQQFELLLDWPIPFDVNELVSHLLLFKEQRHLDKISVHHGYMIIKKHFWNYHNWSLFKRNKVWDF